MIDYPKLETSLPRQYQNSLKPFHDFLAGQSRRETRKIAALIGSARYRKVMVQWRAYLTEGIVSGERPAFADMPVRELADNRIWKAYRRVMKEGGAIDDSSPPAALHELRITCKKLRYLQEFFQSLYPADEIKALIKSLKAFQNVLGEFQDTEVQSQAILEFGREMAAAGVAPVETHMAMGMVAETILQRQETARAEFNDRFREFSDAGVQTAFEKLFRNQG